MKDICFLTDIHLDFLHSGARQRFYKKIQDRNPECLLITGDISEFDALATNLREIDSAVSCPIYFVLGNHDFYRSKIDVVHQAMRDLCHETNKLTYVSDLVTPVVVNDYIIVGHDGWADMRYGNENSSIQLNDDRFIYDLCSIPRAERKTKRRQLADTAAAIISLQLDVATRHDKNNIIVMTHIPPFAEAAWHEGKMSDNDFLPYFTCKAIGDLLFQYATDHPEKKITILTGHTHGKGRVDVLPNLRVITGGNEYGEPEIQNVSWPDLL